MVTSKWRGHPIWLVDGVWYYTASNNPVSEDPNRACGHCKLENTPEGHDGCLGELKGVQNACCGHGDNGNAYIHFNDGSLVQGINTVATINILKEA